MPLRYGGEGGIRALVGGVAVRPDRSTEPVITENSVRSENTGVPIIHEIIVATTMSSLFVALFAFVASSSRTQEFDFDSALLTEAIKATFQRRGTRVPSSTPWP